MRLPLDDIPHDGLDVDLDTATPWVRQAAEVALEGRLTALSGQLRVELHEERDVMVTGAVSATCRRGCDRCARDIELVVDAPLELVYVPALQEGEDARELASSELDQGIYEDGVVDLSFVVQEHLALQLPARLTCEDRGVTPLEEGACVSPATAAIPEETVDPRFAILKGLKLD